MKRNPLALATLALVAVTAGTLGAQVNLANDVATDRITLKVAPAIQLASDRFEVAAGGEVLVGMRSDAGRVGDAIFLFVAAQDAHSILIQPDFMTVALLWSGTLNGGAEAQLALKIPVQLAGQHFVLGAMTKGMEKPANYLGILVGPEAQTPDPLIE